MIATTFKTLGITIFDLCTTEEELAMIERALTNRISFDKGRERIQAKADMKRLDKLRHRILEAPEVFC